MRVGVVSSYEEGNMICEIDGWVLGGMQFGVFGGAGACGVLGFRWRRGHIFARLTAGCYEACSLGWEQVLLWVAFLRD